MNMTHTYTLLQLYMTVLKRVYFGFLQLLFKKVFLITYFTFGCAGFSLVVEIGGATLYSCPKQASR